MLNEILWAVFEIGCSVIEETKSDDVEHFKAKSSLSRGLILFGTFFIEASLFIWVMIVYDRWIIVMKLFGVSDFGSIVSLHSTSCCAWTSLDCWRRGTRFSGLFYLVLKGAVNNQSKTLGVCAIRTANEPSRILKCSSSVHFSKWVLIKEPLL